MGQLPDSGARAGQRVQVEWVALIVVESDNLSVAKIGNCQLAMVEILSSLELKCEWKTVTPSGKNFQLTTNGAI